MLEEVVTKLLVKHLGNFVHLNADNLRLSIWEGTVSLKDLQLKKSALDDLHLPIAVRGGCVGQLVLSIPWKNLSSKPTQVLLEDVFVLIGPATGNETDQEIEQRRQRDKLKKLEDAEEKRKSKDQDDHSESTFAARLAEKIVANLQVTVKNVHVRYEDTTSDPGRPFALGVTISELIATSTNDAWMPTLNTPEAKVIFKLASLRHLAVYWDPLSGPPRQWEELDDAKTFMRQAIPHPAVPVTAHDYVLRPVDAQLKLKIDRTGGLAKVTADVVFDEIALGLQERQYRNFLQVLTVLTIYVNRMKSKYYLISRYVVVSELELADSDSPDRLERFNPRQWWLFAYNCVLSDVRTRRAKWRKEAISVRRRNRLKYLELYRLVLKDKIKTDQKKELDDLETLLDFDDIVFFRSQAERLAAEKKMKKEAEKSRIAARFKTLFTGGNVKSADAITLSADDLAKLASIIDFDPTAPDAVTSTAPWLELRFSLGLGRVDLCSKSGSDGILSLLFSLVTVGVSGRAGGGLNVNVALQTLRLEDTSTKETLLPVVIRSLEVEAEQPVWKLELDLPSDTSSATAVRMWLRPLQIVYAKRCFERAIGFFYLPDSAMVQSLEVAARSQLEKLTNRTRAQLMSALEEHKRVVLMLNLQAPQVILPSDICRSDARAIVLNLGQMMMTTNSPSGTEPSSLSQDQFYDNFSLDLRETQCFSASVGQCSSSLSIVRPARPSDIILEPFGLRLSILQCIVPTEMTLTRVKVSGNITHLQVNAASSCVDDVLVVLKALLSPATDAALHPIPATAGPQIELPFVSDDSEDLVAALHEDVHPVSNPALLLLRRDAEVIFSVDSFVGVVMDVEFQPVAELNIGGLSLEVVERTFDTDLVLHVTDLSISDRTVSPPQALVSGAVIENDTAIVRLHVVLVQPASPEYKDLDQVVTVTTGALSVIARREALTALIAIGASAANGAADLYRMPRTSAMGTLLASEATFIERSVDTLKLNLFLSEVSVTLETDFPIANLSVSRMHLNLLDQPKENKLNLDGVVGGLVVHDLLPDSRFPLALSMDTHQNISFDIVMDESPLAECSTAVKLRIGDLRAIVLPTFVRPLMSYFFEGPLIRALLAVTASKVVEEVRKSVEKVATQQHVKLDIEVGHPQIILPGRDDLEVVVNVGHISVMSKLVLDTDTWEQIDLKLDGFAIVGGNRPLITHSDIVACVLRQLTGGTAVKVTGTLPVLSASLASSQYRLLREIAEPLLAVMPDQTPAEADLSGVLDLHSDPSSRIPAVSRSGPILCEFSLRKLSLLIISDVHTEFPIVELVLDSVSLRFTEHALGRDAQIRLHGLVVHDLTVAPDSVYRSLVTSYLGDSADLVSISFQESGTPLHRSVNVALSALTFNASRDTVALLGMFFLPQTISNHAATARTSQSPREISVDPEHVDTTSMSVKLAVGPVCILLIRDNFPIARVDLSHILVNLDQSQQQGMELNGSIGNLVVTDLIMDQLNSFRRVISFDGDNLVDFKLKQYAQPVAGCAGELYLRCAALRATLLGCFVQDLIAFATDGPLAEVINHASSLSARSDVDEPKVTSVASATFIRLNVAIASPSIVIPAHSSAAVDSAVCVNLGNITVISGPSSSTVHDMTLTVRELCILAAGETLVEKTDIDVTVGLPMIGSGQTTVRGDVSLLSVVVGPKTYDAVLTVVEDNLLQPPRVGTPLSLASPTSPQGSSTKPQALLAATFDVHEIRVLAVGTDGKDIARVRLHSITASFSQTESSREAALGLHSVVIDDLLQPSTSAFPVLLSSTGLLEDGDDGDLITVNFTETLMPARRRIQCVMQALRVNINQETVTELVDLLYVGFVSKIKDLPVDARKSSEPAEAVAETVPLSLQVALGPVSLYLARDGVGILCLDVTSAMLVLEAAGSSLTTKGSLGNISVLDLSVANDDQQRLVLSFDGDSVVDFTFRKFAASHDCDNEFILRTQAVKVQLLPKFIAAVHSYFAEGPLLRAVLAMSASKISEATIEAMDTISPRTRVDVLVGCPLVIIPCVGSDEVIMVDLGQLSVSTEFIEDTAVHRIHLESLQIAAGSVTGMFEPVLHELSAHIDIAQPLIKGNATRISGRIADFSLEIGPRQYNILLGIAREFQDAFSSDPLEITEDTWKCEHCGMRSSCLLDSCDLCKTPRPLVGDRSVHQAFLKADAPRLDSELVVLLGMCAIRIFDEKGPLVQLSVAELSMEARTFKDESVLVHALLMSVGLSDIRPDIPDAARDMLCTQTELQIGDDVAAPPQLEVRMELTPLRDMQLNAVVDNIRIQIVPSALDALARFAVPPLLRKLAIPQKTVTPTSTRKVYTQSASVTRCVFNLSNVEIVILRGNSAPGDLVPAITAAFCLQYDDDVNGKSVALRAFNIGAFVSPLQRGSGKQRTMVEPFTIEADARDFSDGLAVDCNVGNLSVCVSYQDIILLASILGEVKILAEGLETDLGSIQSNGPIAPRPHRLRARSRSLSRAAPYIAIPASPPSETGHDTALPQSARVRLDGITAILINDQHGANTPFLSVVVPGTVAVVADWETALRAHMSLALHMNFYNHLRISWEPLIEPWKAEMHISRLAPPANTVDVRIKSDTMLNLNVTEALISSLCTTIASWSSSDVVQDSDAYSPYWIFNQTGVEVELKVDRKSYFIPPAERLAFAPATQDRSAMLTPTSLVADIQLKDCDVAANVPLDKVGEWLVEVNNRWIICRVEHSGGSRHVRIMSPVVVKNNTSVPLEVAVGAEDVASFLAVVCAQPKDTCGIPLPYIMSMTQLRFRPVGQPIWSNPLTPMQISPGRYLTRCGGVDASEQLYFVVNADAKSQVPDSVPTTSVPVRQHASISLNAPWVVENLTFSSLSVDIRKKVGGSVHRALVESGCRSGIHSAEVHAELIIRVRPEGYQWSSAVVVREGLLDCPVKGSCGQSSLNIEVACDEHGSRVLRVFSPLMIVNATGRPLTLQSSRSCLTLPAYDAARVQSASLVEPISPTRPSPIPTSDDDDVAFASALRSAQFVKESTHVSQSPSEAALRARYLQGETTSEHLRWNTLGDGTIPADIDFASVASPLRISAARYGVLDSPRVKDVTSALVQKISRGQVRLNSGTKVDLPGFGPVAFSLSKKRLLVEYIVGSNAVVRLFDDHDEVVFPVESDYLIPSVTNHLSIIESSYGVLDNSSKTTDVTRSLQALLGGMINSVFRYLYVVDCSSLTVAVSDKTCLPGFRDPAHLQAKSTRVSFRWGNAVCVRYFPDSHPISFPLENDVRPYFPANVPELVILRAEYGVLNSKQVVEVTDQIKWLLGSGASRLSLPAGSKNFLPGFGDPAFMHAKQLAITYTVGGGHPHRMVAGEFDSMDIPSDEALQLTLPHPVSDEVGEPAKALFSASDMKVTLQLDNSQLSKAVSVGAVGNSGSVALADVIRLGQPTGLFNLGVTVSLAPSLFRRTRIVTIRSHFILLNKSHRAIVVKQRGTNISFVVEPNRKRPFHWVDGGKPFVVCVKYLEGSAHWSGGFDMHIMEEFELSLRRPFAPPQFIRVSISESDASCLVTFSEPDEEHPPFRVVNELGQQISYHQEGIQVRDTVGSGCSAAFSWDEPMQPHHLIIQTQDGASATVELDRVGDVEPTHLSEGFPLRAEIVAEGPTRVLFLRSSVHSSYSQLTEIQSSFPVLSMSITISGIGISVCENMPRELLFISLRQLKAEVTLTNSDRKVRLIVGDLQIDNQLANCQFPVILAMTPKEVLRSVIEASVVQSIEHTSIDFFRYAALLVQELDIRLEADFVAAVIAVARRILTDLEPLLERSTNEEDSNSSRRVYFELLHLQPFRAHVTFASGASLSADPSIGSVLQAIGFTLANVDNAPLKLNSLALEHLFGGRQLVGKKLATHYTRQAIAEAYKVIGSFDAIGNPVGLFDSVTTGVLDFFYEPVRGVVAGPEAFGRGLARGSISLVKNTVYGVMNAGTRITGTIGKGVAALSFDTDYLADRERDSRTAPSDMLEGLGLGGVAFAKGLFDAVTGLVVQPVKGAQQEGALGFMKGVGRGLVGTVVKPVAGILDLTSKTLEGIRNTTTAFDAKRERVRVPRSFGTDGELRPFHMGTELLNHLQEGSWRGDRYISHLAAEGGRFALLSSKRLLLTATSSSRCLWQVPLFHIERVSVKHGNVSVQILPRYRPLHAGMAGHVFQVVDESAAVYFVQEIMNARGLLDIGFSDS